MIRGVGRNQFLKYRVIINVLIMCFSVLGKKLNYGLLKTFRNTNGKVGLLLRYIFLKNCCKNVGVNVSVHPGVYLFNLHNIEIGNNVSIHPMCYLDAYGSISIGSDVSIAHNTSIISVNHTWDDVHTPIKYNIETISSVIIKDDVWIGCGVRILPGVIIEKRSIIAAGAVVNKSFEGNSLIGGVPAKKIKSINEF